MGALGGPIVMDGLTLSWFDFHFSPSCLHLFDSDSSRDDAHCSSIYTVALLNPILAQLAQHMTFAQLLTVADTHRSGR